MVSVLSLLTNAESHLRRFHSIIRDVNNDEATASLIDDKGGAVLVVSDLPGWHVWISVIAVAPLS